MKKLLNTLYITTPERYLSLDGENVVISAEHSNIGRIPLHNIDSIIIFGASGASPALMGKCVENNISLVFMTRSGRFLCRTEGTVSGNVLLRRQQYRLADDKCESLKIARNMIAGKIFNSRYSVERTIRDHSLRIDIEKFRKKSSYLFDSAKSSLKVNDFDTLRGMEGEAASVYFSVFDDMILQQKEDFYFHGRNKRPPLDNVNALLSFAYSLMTNMCTAALESVGLDPYVGFMHTDRPGRASLSLDLIEEFRSVICDRFVISVINKKIINDKDFQKREDGAVLLSEDARKVFLNSWQKYKYEEIKHPFLGDKIERGMLPYVQALLLARYIRGDLDEYPVFMWK